MTDIAFHFNLPQPLAYACRLLRKAYVAGARVGVVADGDTLRELDRQLWTFSALDFIPHCAASAEPAMLARTPVVLGVDGAPFPHADVLLNLGHTVPTGFERFARLIEFVGLNDDDRAHGRARWKHYASRGYNLKRFDAQAQEPIRDGD